MLYTSEGGTPTTAERRVSLWLLLCCAAVFATVVVGGVTRLTRSGLSIVEWKPVSGIVPPRGEEAWLREFARYQQTPEYQKVNRGMDLEGFKRIYWVEFTHRVLGRTIGLVFLVPFLVLLARGDIPRRLVPTLIGFFLLGGAQGALGWFMVKSGLVDDPKVSPYRLTAHLGLAVAIYAWMLWVALGLRGRAAAGASPAQRRAAAGFAALVFLMILTGGLVAGTRAGFAFNTFPFMMGRVVPPGLFGLTPWWLNFFQNILTVQFTHRVLAVVVACAAAAVWVLLRGAPLAGGARVALHALPLAVAGQITLGIATLLAVVPVWLGAAHQAGAMVVFTLALMVARGAGVDRAAS